MMDWIRVIKSRRIVFAMVIAFVFFTSFHWFFLRANENHITGRMQPVKNEGFEPHHTPSFVQHHMCPACFGYRACRRMDLNALKFTGDMLVDEAEQMIWKNGALKNQKVLVSFPSGEQWKKFDEFICINSSAGDQCDPSISVRRTYLGKKQRLTVEGLKALHDILDIPNKAMLSKCATSRFLKNLIRVFDDNFDKYLSQEEKIIMLTSLLLHPSYVLAKFQVQLHINLPIPEIHGGCGRTVIYEGGLIPLAAIIDNQPIKVRVGLALQILRLVELFEHKDPQWFFVFFGFTVDNLAVTKFGKVVLIDLSEMIILDRTTLFINYEMARQKVCNMICFQNITRELHTSDEHGCKRSYEYSQLMYAIICKQVLSDLEEHRERGFLNFDGYRIHQKSKIGLLHSIPPLWKLRVENMLRECVLETTPASRLVTVYELTKLLEHIFFHPKFHL